MLRDLFPTARPLLFLASLFPALAAATPSVPTAAGDEVTSSAESRSSVDALPRPRVLMTPQKLFTLREEVRQPGWKRDIYLRTVRANAERWVDRSIRVPQRGGWIMDFVCTDGTTLTIPGDQDFGTTTSYCCPACGAAYSGTKIEAARRRIEHEWLMGAARDLALAGVLEENNRYLAKAASILLGYADARFPRHTPGMSGGIFKQSLNDAVAIIWLAQAYDLLASTDVLSRESRERICRDLLWESAEGLTRCGLAGNWGSWHLSAVGVIGLATGHQRFIDYADNAFRVQMERELGSDGLWPESVHGYHFYALRAFIDYAEAAANCGTDLYQFEARPGQGLRAMFAAPLSFMYPNLELPAINDGFVSEAMPFEQYEVAWARYKDPRFGWLLAQRPRTRVRRPRGAQSPSAQWALIHGDPLPDNPQAPEFGSANFAHLGTCVLRNDSTLPRGEQVMLTFDYGRMLGHGQFDKMGITLFGAGRILAADYGTPGYASAISPFYSGTLAHNTVMVDGANQSGTAHHGLLFFQDEPGLKAACAETTEAYPGVFWRRTVILDDGGAQPHVLVIDELESTAPRRFDWCFHSEGERLTLSGLSDGKTSAPGDYRHGRYLSDLKSFEPTGKAVHGDWHLPDGAGLSLITAPGEGTKVSTAQFPAETATRRVPGMILSRHGTQTTYAVLLKPSSTPSSTPPPLVSMPRPGQITVADHQATRTYFITPAGVVREAADGDSPRP